MKLTKISKYSDIVATLIEKEQSNFFHVSAETEFGQKKPKTERNNL